MLTDGVSASVAANSTSNIIVGRSLEFLGAPSVVRLLLAGDAAGLQVNFLINIGGNQMSPIAPGTSVNVSSVAGAGPKDDEDTICPAVSVPAGARSQLNITNTTGGAIVVRYRAFIQ